MRPFGARRENIPTMSVLTNGSPRRPRVCLVGEHEHPDFVEAVALLRRDAEITSEVDARLCPELIVVAQSRPGVCSSRRIEQLRRVAPLAGIVALLGTWCEGRYRSSRPAPDGQRLYWYQFPAWWRRQKGLLAAGRCPEWARPRDSEFQTDVPSTEYSILGKQRSIARGLIALKTRYWEMADTLAAVLQGDGYAIVWQPTGRIAPTFYGTAAGIWDGCQLDDREAEDLAAFCRQLADDSAPVIALLDFPRRDRCEVAGQAGAAFVIGKPWSKSELLGSLKDAMESIDSASAA
jgi:hypothetical protein